MNEVKFKANVEDLKSLSLVVDEIEEAVDAIPVPAVADDGKLLGVTLDESGETPVAQYELVDAPDPLPAIAAGDAGKVLTVNAGETGVEWGSISASVISHEQEIRPQATSLVSAAQTGCFIQEVPSVTVNDARKTWIGCLRFDPLLTETRGTSGGDAVTKHFIITPLLKYDQTNSVKPALLIVCLEDPDSNYSLSYNASLHKFTWLSQ